MGCLHFHRLLRCTVSAAVFTLYSPRFNRLPLRLLPAGYLPACRCHRRHLPYLCVRTCHLLLPLPPSTCSGYRLPGGLDTVFLPFLFYRYRAGRFHSYSGPTCVDSPSCHLLPNSTCGMGVITLPACHHTVSCYLRLPRYAFTCSTPPAHCSTCSSHGCIHTYHSHFRSLYCSYHSVTECSWVTLPAISFLLPAPCLYTGTVQVP